MTHGQYEAFKLHIPEGRPIRILLTGVWDLFHFGHAQAMEQAKHIFPNTVLCVGIHSDETVLAMKGRVVLYYEERKALLYHIKWIDEIIDNAPWVPDTEYLESHNIDLVTGDVTITKTGEDIYKPLKAVGRFIPIPRTPGISSTSILTRIVRNYDMYVNKSLDMSRSLQDLNVSYLKNMAVTARWQIHQAMSGDWFSSFNSQGTPNRNLRIGSFINGFGERMLHNWNILAAVKEIVIRDRETTPYMYPSKEVLIKEEPVSQYDDKFRLFILERCRKYVHGWRYIENIEDVRISVVPGGLTNRLYKISIAHELVHKLKKILSAQPITNEEDLLQDKEGDIPTLMGNHPMEVPDQVLFRLYGEGTEMFFNRLNEHQIFKTFSKRAMGPKLYGIFENGRIEEFLSLRTLEKNDLATLSPLIAEKLAAMHASPMPGLSTDPSLFDSLWNWLKNAEDISFPDDCEKQALLDSFQLKTVLPAELSKLQAELLKTKSPVVFCHNDLLAGNIMYDEKAQRLCFIDYEYGAYNFRGFDIGNHFCECAINYGLSEFPHFSLCHDDYPNTDQQHEFLTIYLTTFKKLRGLKPEIEEEELSALMKEVNMFALASHFLWAVWAIIQDSISEIEFGYLEFAQARLNAYYHFNKIFIPDKRL